MGVLERVLLPAVVVLGGLGNAVTRALGVRPADARARLMSSAELEVIVDESYAHGELRGREHLFIANIFDFSERTVAHVMTPRNRVIGLPLDASEDQALSVLCEARFSRYPVYDQDQDHVVGVLHVKDLARWQAYGSGPFDLRHLLRTPVFVPETLGLEAMLARLRRERSSIAIAFDEFGGTAGVVTFEDIAEEIVGEIRDEFDQEEISPIEMVSAWTARVRGDVILDELNQHLDLTLAHPESETVAGLVMDLLGRMAHAGDAVTFGGVTFEVEAVDGRAIRTVLVRLPAARGTRD
jgi:CBS domain containing-hemolysin-like protein